MSSANDSRVVRFSTGGYGMWRHDEFGSILQAFRGDRGQSITLQPTRRSRAW